MAFGFFYLAFGFEPAVLGPVGRCRRQDLFLAALFGQRRRRLARGRHARVSTWYMGVYMSQRHQCARACGRAHGHLCRRACEHARRHIAVQTSASEKVPRALEGAPSSRRGQQKCRGGRRVRPRSAGHAVGDADGGFGSLFFILFDLEPAVLGPVGRGRRQRHLARGRHARDVRLRAELERPEPRIYF